MFAVEGCLSMIEFKLLKLNQVSQREKWAWIGKDKEVTRSISVKWTLLLTPFFSGAHTTCSAIQNII
jgi:hypothetical protein